jgi:ribose-phosphate pyrophosphokinase
METLNLANPNDPLSLEFKISSFPDGQQSIRILEDDGMKYQDMVKIPNITIKSRLNTFRDLELIICSTHALRELGIKNISLYIPYCIGGRSDRKFSEGGFNYIKNVIAPVINLQGYTQVEIMDPHSDVLEACINNFKKIDNVKLVQFALKDYFLEVKGKSHSDYATLNLVSPDAGALKKVFHVAENIGFKGEVIIASKHRNLETGQIDYTNVPLSVHDADKDMFIIDDICDGGRTFIEIAKAIKQSQNLSSAVTPDRHGKVYLIVTHGIFSAGFGELNKYFDRIYSTNSIADHDNSQLKQLNVF